MVPNREATVSTRVRVRTTDPGARAGLVERLTAVGVRLVEPEGPEADVTVWDVSGGPLPWMHGEPTLALLGFAMRPTEAIAAGARGAIAATASTERLVAATLAVAHGLCVTDGLLAADCPLTPRELEVLRALAGGMPTKLVADQLGVSENTVKYHAQHIHTKLGVNSRVESVMIAARRGWLAVH